MKTILIIGAIASSLFLAACESTQAPTSMGPTSGVKSQSNHAGNTTGGGQ